MAYTREKTGPQNDGMRYTLRRELPEPNHTRVSGGTLRLHIPDMLDDPATGGADEKTTEGIERRRIGKNPGHLLTEIVGGEGLAPPSELLEERDRIVGPLQVYAIGMNNGSRGTLLLQLLTTEIKTLLSHPTPP